MAHRNCGVSVYKTRLKFADLPIYRIYLCPGTATLPIYPTYHGPKSGEIYQFTDLPNLPLPGERSLLSIMPYTVTA